MNESSEEQNLRKQSTLIIAQGIAECYAELPNWQSHSQTEKNLYGDHSTLATMKGVKECDAFRDRLDKVIKQVELAISKGYITEKPAQYDSFVTARQNIDDAFASLKKQLDKDATSTSKRALYKAFLKASDLPAGISTMRTIAQNSHFKDIWQEESLPSFVKQGELIELIGDDINRADKFLLSRAVCERIFNGNGSQEALKTGNDFFIKCSDNLSQHRQASVQIHEQERLDKTLQAFNTSHESVLAAREATVAKKSKSSSMLSIAAQGIDQDKKTLDENIKPTRTPKLKSR